MVHNIYGCKPPLKDVRDYRLAKVSREIQLPTTYRVDNLPKVKNQRSVSSCVAHTTSSILEYHNKNSADMSTNFIYGIQYEHCGHDGKGMYLRDACKIVKDFGDMIEEDCPGNTEVPKCHSIAEEAIKDEDKLERASTFKIKSYFNCTNNDEIKRAIIEYGPVLASIKWYENFDFKDGVLTGTKKGDYGYHAIMIYGWNEKGFLCQNSWGTGWGDKGRFTLSYDIPIAEAKGMVDAEDSELIIPKRNRFLDVIYKIINFILNVLRK